MHGKIKSAAFWVIMLLATWFFLEAVSFTACRILNGAWFSFPAAREQLVAVAPPPANVPVTGVSDLKWDDFVEVLHPYAGFVADPQQNKPNWKVSDFGFVLSDRASPIVKRSPGKTIIGLFGGSFTNGVYLSLKFLLENKSAALGQDFVVINFAAGGYKQPQQLIILNYLLALGAEFDIVVNLDGFNEVALPTAENIPGQVNPFYPRGWDRRVAHAISPGTVRLIGLVEETKERRKKWAQRFRSQRFYLSPTLFLVWQLRDRKLARTIYETNEKIREGAKTQSYAMRGPSYTYRDEEELYRDLADVWKRSSVQMNNLCAANGARYFHFLQPNQYVEGSKPISADEKQRALNESSLYGRAVAKGYPVLAKVGQDLRDAGVNFTDLTMIYAANRQPLYIDDCCHTNTEGYNIVAQRVYEIIQSKP